MNKSKKILGFLFVLPSLIGVLIFYIIPFIWSFMYCFTTGVVNRKFVGLNNFKLLFSNEAYRLAIKNTVTITAIAVPAVCVISLTIALLIEKNLKKYRKLQGILLVPMAIPAASLVLVWQDLWSSHGIVNDIFNLQIDWLGSAFASLIITGIMIWKNVGYNILIVISALLALPKEYEEAAYLEGAGTITRAVCIKLPNIMHMIFFLVIISLFNSFKIFREVYLLQGSYPNENLYLLQHFMNNNFNKLNYEQVSAAAFLLYIVIFVVIYVMSYLQRRYTEGLN